MSAGRLVAGRPVYAHRLVCAAAAERVKREKAEEIALALRGLASEAANLPADPRGIGDLGSYVERFGLGPCPEGGCPEGACGLPPPFADGVTLSIRFCAASAGPRVPTTGFTLRGNLGSGKTTLLAALARSLVDRAVRVRWETVPELYNRLLGLVRGGGRLEEALRELATVPVLFLDDLGREKPSPWYVDQVLFPVVDERYRNGRPIIASTNHTWKELQRRYCGAANERGEASDSGPMIRDRLEEVAMMVEFGPTVSLRRARSDFLEVASPERVPSGHALPAPPADDEAEAAPARAARPGFWEAAYPGDDSEDLGDDE